jgi:hypothetical protein
MNRIALRPAVAPQRRAPGFTRDAIEWEELPSLAAALRRADTAPGVGHVWLSTEPMPLQPLAAEAPMAFAEPIHGLQVREVDSDVFSHFFGDPRANH